MAIATATAITITTTINIKYEIKRRKKYIIKCNRKILYYINIFN